MEGTRKGKFTKTKRDLAGAEQKDANIEKITHINLNNIDNIFNGSNSNFNNENIILETSRRK